MLNWIVWNRTDIYIKTDLALNNLQRLICHKTQPPQTKKTDKHTKKTKKKKQKQKTKKTKIKNKIKKIKQNKNKKKQNVLFEYCFIFF